jgi:hypothetical protein
LVALKDGETHPSGLTAVHGVVHRLRPADFAMLTNMEHEYWWVDSQLLTPLQQFSQGLQTVVLQLLP